MRVQKDHDAANDLLVGPAGRDLSGTDFADTRNFTKTFGDCSITSKTAAPKDFTSLPA